MEIKDILYNLMVSAGYNQRELARYTGLTESAISRYMKGERKPDIYKFITIAAVCGYVVKLEKI